MFIQINQALKHASLKSYSLYKDGDGDQCLKMFMRDPIEVLLELFLTQVPLASNISSTKSIEIRMVNGSFTIRMVHCGGNGHKLKQ